MKNHILKKTLLCMGIPLVVITTSIPFPYSIVMAETVEQEPSRTINVVYDDSNSMYFNYDKQENLDRWAYAKYSMEVFAALLGTQDQMNIFYLSDFYKSDTTNKAPKISISGQESAETRVSKIHHTQTDAQGTPFLAVEAAYQNLLSYDSDEKWLVVLTDGEFFESDNSSPADPNKFFQSAQDGINIVYLAIGEEAVPVQSGKNIFNYSAASSKEILNEVTSIANRIFSAHSLVLDEDHQFSFDIPMKQLTIFAQGENVNIKEIKDKNNQTYLPEPPVKVQYSPVDARGKNNQPVTELNGSIAPFNEIFEPGSYTAEVDGAQTIEIYYKPELDVAISLVGSEGRIYTPEDQIPAGTYEIHFDLVRSSTQEAVSSSLIGEVDYSAKCFNDGLLNGVETINQGEKIDLQAGKCQIQASASFLNFTALTTLYDFDIYSNTSVLFSEKTPSVFIINENGQIEGEPIQIEASLPNQTMTSSQWEAMDLPTVKVGEKADSRIASFDVQKSNEIGVFLLRPVLKNEKFSGTELTSIDYVLDYSQSMNNGTWSGYFQGEAHFKDERSFLEKIKPYFPLIGSILGLLLLLILYGPKKRFGRIDKTPKILQKDGLGGSTVVGHGEFHINFWSRICPLGAETAEFRYLPKGPVFPGNPKVMKLKALGRGKIALINFSDFEEKPFAGGGSHPVLFDGMPISNGDGSKTITKITQISMTSNTGKEFETKL